MPGDMAALASRLRVPPGRGGRRVLTGDSYAVRPSRSARRTASARLRTFSLRYSALVCSFTVWGERNRRSAISLLVAPEAISVRTSRSRSDSGAEGCSERGENTVIPLPTIRTAIATSFAAQSFDTKPDAPAALAACGEIQPAPEIRSTRVRGDARRIASDSS